jgi:probable phosphoglycerate mutase
MSTADPSPTDHPYSAHLSPGSGGSAAGGAPAGSSAPGTPGRVVLVRHGQTEWSRSGQHTSVTDLDLTEHGVAQAREVTHLLVGMGVRPATVWSSPRLRAQRTATLAGLTVDEVVPDLTEWNYGEYEGLTSKEIHRDRPGWSVFADGCPGGETPEDVAARADRVLARARTVLDRGDVVLVGHGHFTRSLAVRWIDLPIGAGALLAMDAAALTVLGVDRGRPIVQHSNVVPFLADPQGIPQPDPQADPAAGDSTPTAG